jgi:hypothetical protein
MKTFFKSELFLELVTSVFIGLIILFAFFWITSPEQWYANKHISNCEGAMNEHFECDCMFQNDCF